MLDTYANLQTAIGNWLNRADLTSQIPDFITLSESQLRRRLKMALRDGVMLPRNMVDIAQFNISSELAGVPGDFLGVLSFSIPTDGASIPEVQLDYVDPQNLEYLKQKRGTNAAATTPGVFSIVGSDFQFLPAPDKTYTATLVYWQDFTSLSGSNASNWILANHPDVYLYGALTQSAPYLRDDNRTETWGTLFVQAMDDLLKADPLPPNRAWLRMEAGLTFRPNSTTTFNINTGDFSYGP